MEIPETARLPFDEIVWEIVRQIPHGKVTSYGFIASFIPLPKGVSEPDYIAYRARWVGTAMARSPSGVPWHRVINAQGKLSPRPSGGQNLQRRLLEGEGVKFDAKDRVDMKRYTWSGPSEDWLKQRGLVNPSGGAYSQDKLL